MLASVLLNEHFILVDWSRENLSIGLVSTPVGYRDWDVIAWAHASLAWITKGTTLTCGAF
jgi:hypothetical protein